MTDSGGRDGLSRLLGILLTAVLSVLGFQGCETDAAPDSSPATIVGSDLVLWDEARYPDIQDNPELEAGARLITTEQEREAFLASEPLGPDMTDVAAVDLQSSVIVVGAYWSCTEVGAVFTDGTSVWFDAPATDDYDCAWSPFTALLVEVPREDFPGDVELSAPPGS